MPAAPDLDSAAEIDRFVDAFYGRVLADPLLAPLFTDVARVDLAAHLPRIRAYWRKMLLGEDVYKRHMMRRHRAVDARRRFTDEHYERWVLLFEETLSEGFAGPVADRAGGLARRIAGNMRQNIAQFRS